MRPRRAYYKLKDSGWALNMASPSQASDIQKQVEETSICWSHQRGPQAFIQFLEAWMRGGSWRLD